MRVFVTGGAGYIGSHTCVELLNAGHEVVIFDKFSNSNPNVISKIEEITDREINLIAGDIRNESELVIGLVMRRLASRAQHDLLTIFQDYWSWQKINRRLIYKLESFLLHGDSQ